MGTMHATEMFMSSAPTSAATPPETSPPSPATSPAHGEACNAQPFALFLKNDDARR